MFPRFLILFLISCPVIGCVVPIPSHTDIAPALSVRVIDSQTGDPIEGAAVVHRFDEDIIKQAQSEIDGRCTIEELQQAHWGHMIGVALNYPMPYRKVFPGQQRETELQVMSPGYDPYRRRLIFHKAIEEDGLSVRCTAMPEIVVELVRKSEEN